MNYLNQAQTEIQNGFTKIDFHSSSSQPHTHTLTSQQPQNNLASVNENITGNSSGNNSYHVGHPQSLHNHPASALEEHHNASSHGPPIPTGVENSNLQSRIQFYNQPSANMGHEARFHHQVIIIFLKFFLEFIATLFLVKYSFSQVNFNTKYFQVLFKYNSIISS